MAVRIEDAGVCKKKLSFEISAETIQERIDKTLDEITEEAQIPGFRPGHAPRRLVLRKLRDQINDRVKSELIAEEYKKAVEDNELQILREDEFDPDTLELPKEGALTFEVEVEVKPEVTVPDYQNIKLEVHKVEIRDEDVRQSRDNLLRSRGRFVEQKKTTKIAERDMLTADISITCGEQKVFEETGGTLAVFPQAVGGIHLDNLVDELSGKKAGDTVTIKAEVPEGHQESDLVGQEAEVSITIKSIRRLELPEFNDEFAQSVGYDSTADLEAELRQRLGSDIGEIRERSRREALAGWLLEHVEFEVPEGVARANAGRVFNQQLVDLQRRGVPVEQIEERADELREACNRRAQRELKLSFIFETIAKKEKIEVSEDEVQARVGMIADGYGRPADRLYADMEKRGLLDSIREQVRDDKIFRILLEKAEISEVAPPAPATEKKAEPAEKAAEKAEKKEAPGPSTKLPSTSPKASGTSEKKKEAAKRKAPEKLKTKKTKAQGDKQSKETKAAEADDEAT